MRTLPCLALALGGASVMLLAASCAESNSVREPEPQNPSIVLDSGSSEPTDGASAECGVDGASCLPARSCETSDFCPTTLPLSGRYILTSVWGSSKDDVWAVGSGGVIVRWNGTAWTSLPSGFTTTFRSVSGSGPEDVWIVSSRAGVHRSLGLKDGAIVWAPKAPPVVPYNFEWNSDLLLNSVWVDQSDVWVAGEVAWAGACTHLWRARLSGTSVEGWDDVAEHACTPLFATRGVGPNELWSVGGGAPSLYAPVVGRTFRGTRLPGVPDGGATFSWEELDSQADVLLLAVWGTPEGGVWAVGERGTIRHYLPGGVRWSVVASPTTETLRGLWGSAPNDIWAVGDHSTILHFDGESWSPATTASTLPSTLYGIWGSGPNDIWAVGEGTVLHATGKKP